MNKILIIGSGKHHNTLGVIRAIGRSGLEIELITFDGSSKNYVAKSKYVTNHYVVNGIDQLFSYLCIKKHYKEKQIIISCADSVTEYLNLHIDVLSHWYIIPGNPQQGKMQKLMDKITMISMVAKHGIYAPKVWRLPSDINEILYPCITKALISSHGDKSDIVICHSRTELETFLKDNNDEIFAQAYIKKKEEIQFFGCSLYSGNEIIIPGMSKVLRSQSNSNTGFLEFGPIDPFYNDIVENAKKYIRDCEYSGLFSFEIIRGEDDMVWFLEINFRNDGNAICVTEAGVNLPLIWVKANQHLDYSSEFKTPKKIFVMPEFQDIKLLLQRKVRLTQWLKDLLKTNSFMEYDKDDKQPFFYYIFNKIF